MSDLEGDDAFDRVLDKLIEATSKNSYNEGLLAEARSATATARVAQRTLEEQVAVLRKDVSRYTGPDAEKAFTELYDSVEEAIRVLGGGSDAATGLRAKMIEAKKFIDPIPF